MLTRYRAMVELALTIKTYVAPLTKGFMEDHPDCLMPEEVESIYKVRLRAMRIRLPLASPGA